MNKQNIIGGGDAEVQPLFDPKLSIQIVITKLQEHINKDYHSIRDLNTCSNKFITYIDILESKLSEFLEKYGFEKISSDILTSLLRSSKSSGEADLVIGAYSFHDVIIEIGLRGLNRCKILKELTNDMPPRFYARIYIGYKQVDEIEPLETSYKEKEAETHYII